MRVAVFFVYLCFLLFKGDVPVYAGAFLQKNSSEVHTLSIAPQHQANNSGIGQDYTLLEDNLSDTEKEYLVFDDAEDEDTDHGLAKKYRVLVQRYITHYYQALTGYRCQRFFGVSPNCYASSPRYITQRVLRI